MKAASIANQRHKPWQTMHVLLIRVLMILFLWINASVVSSWSPNYVTSLLRSNEAVAAPLTAMQLSKKAPLDNDNVEDDWRDFRAQLVRSEKTEQKDNREQDEEHWAYETGDFVERGSIVVSVPSSCSFLDDVDSLNSICYRKSIVLVLDSSTSFIQGIVLNRPTNIGVKEGADGMMKFVQHGHVEVFENEIGLGGGTHDPPHRWKIWFGGEVGGPYSDVPQVMCLHSVTTDMAKSVSDAVIPGIYMTSSAGAQKIVQSGDANPSDFWIFCGICGWETKTFYREMHEEGLWHIVSADSGTILEELNMLRCEEEEENAPNCDVDADPRNAGLHTWEMLMEKIGRSDEAHENSDEFGDLMLHEWATGALSFAFTDEPRGVMSETITQVKVGIDDDGSFMDLANYDPAYDMTIQNESREPTMVGKMIRGSSAQRSPYLLSDQGFHKSLILILSDGDDHCEGVILNHVTTSKVSFDLENGKSFQLNLRYGGPTFTYEDEDGNYVVPTFHLHSNDAMRDNGVGVPIGNSGLYKMAKKEVLESLESGIASSGDIFVIQGFSVWNKRGDHHTGVVGEIENEYFEIVPRSQIKTVWKILSEQKVLSPNSLDYNMLKGRQAWTVAREGGASDDDDDEVLKVFGSDIDVSSLADEAVRRWVNVNLLEE